MEFQDKMLKCIDCGADFVFTSGEQLFFHDKQFRNEPKRCKSCKAKRVAVLGAANTRTSRFVENRDPRRVFAVRQRDHGTVQADAGTSRTLPGMFPAEAASGVGLI